MKRLRAARKMAKITMKTLGEKVGVSESAISQYEAGKREADFETVLKIAEVLGCSTDYLLGEEEESERTVEFSPARLQEAMGEMSCEEFAKKFDGNAKVISLYLNGTRKPSKVTLHLMAIYLGVNLEWLCGFDVPKYKRPAPTNENGLDEELVTLIRRIPADRMPEVERYLRFQAEHEETP